jgi:hypothetical protein
MVTFADVETTLTGWLRAALAGLGREVWVSTRREADDPDTAVRVARAGGRRVNLVQDRPLVLFEVWGGSDVEAGELAIVTRALVQSLNGTAVEGVFISWTDEVSGPAFLPHPSGASRYVMTEEFTVVGHTETIT